jgi:hypothetical protein
MNTKYSNLEVIVQDIINIVDDYVKTEIDAEDREYIIDSSTTYEVLDEKNLYNTVMKILSGLNDEMFEIANDEGVFTNDDYDLDMGSDLSKLVYTYYFENKN